MPSKTRPNRSTRSEDYTQMTTLLIKMNRMIPFDFLDPKGLFH